MTPISISPATPEHHSLILDSFWREYRNGSPYAKGVPPNVLTGKMESLLLSPLWRAIVAAPDGEADPVLGYLVYRDEATVGWLHVIREWRKKGVARALLAHAGIQRGQVACAFLPPEVAKEATKRGWTLRFRPYLPDIAMDEQAQRIVALMDGGA